MNNGRFVYLRKVNSIEKFLSEGEIKMISYKIGLVNID